jgi:hypothetical protein
MSIDKLEDARRTTRAALELAQPAFEHIRLCTSPSVESVSLLRERPTIRMFEENNDPDECTICDGDAEDCDVDGVCWGARVRAFLARVDAKAKP